MSRPTSPRLSHGSVHVMVRPADAYAGEVRRALADGPVLPAHLFYETPGGAANWTELTTDSAYASLNDSARLFRADSDGIGRAVAELTRGRPASVISLGPGSGWKDELVVDAMLGASSDQQVHYYALDTSSILACQAMTRFLTNDALAGRAVEASALVGRFDDLPALRPAFERDAGVNVVMLLGNTLGNLADERGLLESIHESTDLLLLEVTLQKPGTDEIASLGDYDSIRRFNFEPLAALGLEFAPDELTYRLATDRSTIPGTLSIVASYANFVLDGRRVASADLAYVHRYTAEAIPTVLAEAGFSACGSPWFGPDRRAMLVLARKT